MATTCNVRQNAIDYLKNKKVINDYMTIVSPLFYLENNKLTNYAKQKYGLKTEGSLFKSRRIVKQDIIRGGNAIPVNDVYKVDVNEELFKELQEQYDIVEQRKEDLGLVSNPLKEKTLNKATAYNSKLAKKLQNKLKQLYPEIKLNIENNPSWEYGDNILNQEDFDNSVNYRLKLIEGLLKLAEPKIDKRNRKYGEVNEPERLTIRLNTKERPNLETNIRKTLNNKGVTNQQVDFVFKYMRSNNIREISVNDLIIQIANNYSYSVEINPSFLILTDEEIAQNRKDRAKIGAFEMDGSWYYSPIATNSNNYIKRTVNGEQVITKDEYDKQKQKFVNEAPAERNIPTNYYEGLSVPGGINYRENEIATKDITPIRKGHAAFATDKGIGWFRSDDKSENAELVEYDDDKKQRTIQKTRGGTPTKTRRILEVQSDLFQKNRDEKVLSKKLVSQGLLIKIKNRIDDKNKKLDIGQKFNIDGTWFEITDYKEGNNKLLYEVTNLRNKKTGFVSGTTIYEAVKKYYDTTLESDEFLQLLNKDNNWVTFFIKSIIQDSAKKGYEKVLFPSGDTASKVEGHSTLEEFKKEKQDRIAELKKRQNKIDSDLDQGFYGMDTSEYEISSNKISEEIEALEKELERVEGPEGFAALKPIYNFYQNIVTNVLKKQGYTPKEITDEYGNKWNEISLNQNRDLKNILLQKDEANQIIGQANINAMTVLIDSVNQKQDTLPHEYAHHYIAWFRNTSLVQEAISKWGSEEALVQSIGEQAVVQEGEAWNWWNSFVEWIYNLFNSLSNKDKQELTNILTDAFLKGIDLETGTVGISDERSRELAKASSKVVKTKTLFDSNNKLANQVYEILGATEEEKSEAEQLYLIYRSNRNPNIEDGSEQDIQEFQKYFEELQDEYAEYDEAIDVYKAEKELFNDTETFGETFEEQDEDDGIEFQLTKDEPVVNQQPDQSIDEKIELFLQNIGVSLKSVNEIRDRNGNVVTDAIAKADMLNKIVEVVADRQLLDTLPEEAAHFFVNMLGENSPLYKQMFNKITDYKLYAETVEQYRKNKSYRKADGTLNIDKLKKEAVGKVIAQHIIGNDTGLETTPNVNFLLNWWNKVWNFVKSFFVKADENPFETSAQQILEGNVKELSDDYTENEEYYQLADPFGGLISDQVNIKLDDSIDNRTGQKRHIYTYKDKPAKGSVTTYYVDRWLKKIFRSDQRSEAQKLIDLAKADFGDDVHLQIKKIFDSWLNEDGTKRSVQKSVERIVPAGPTYTILNNYVKSLLDTYDNKTRFLTEIKIFDQQKQIAGSIDLLVYTEDGSVDIYDWKSQEIYRDQEDIKSYKEPMYRIQLENYKKILEKQYGFKKFNKVRAIPIKTEFIYRNGEIYNIKNIEIGNIDPTKIPDEKSYLLPVTLKEERTDDEDLDLLLKKLNAIYSKIETSKYPNEEKYLKREELNQLRLAIRDLRLKTRIDKLITFGLTQHKKYSDLLESDKLTGKDAENAIRILNVFEESSNLLSGIREEYFEVLKEKDDKKEIAKYEAVSKNFSYMSGQVRSLIKKIQKYQNQKVKEKADSKGIKGILDAEAQLNAIAGNFQALSNINRTSFKLFSNLLRKSQAIRDSRYEASLKKLVQLKKEFKDWTGSKGLSTTEAINKILQLDDKGNWNGNFLSKYKTPYYAERENAIKTGNVKWFMDNVDYDIEAYKKEEKIQREKLSKIQFFVDKKENKEAIEKKLKEWIQLHRAVDEKGRINFTALSNRQNRFVLPQDKWISSKWADLQKPENAPLKKMYDYFQELTTYSKQLGMLDGNVKGFIPSMANDKIDQLVFGQYSKIFSTKGFFDNLEVDSGTMYTPQIDPTDGSIVNTIPVYFTSDYGVKREDGTMDYSKKSRDLFKVFGIWAGHMYNYEAMQTLEDDAIMILNVERNKEKLVTDSFGDIRVEDGVVRKADKNDKNSQILEDFINYYLYNKQSDQLTDVAFKVGKKEYSLLKSVTSAMQWFSLKTLAFNPISGTANFVGGTGNTLFTAQKGIVYTKKTWADAIWRITSGDKKAKAALDYFSVLADGKSEELINDLSLSTVNKYVNTNNAFLIQRKLDKAVERPSALALMLEHMIEDGKIVNIQQFVKNKYNYNETFYNLSKSERSILREKIDKEVGELKKTRSLIEVGTINKDGEFELPGIEKESDVYADFRSKIKGINKKIIGNQTREDINRIRTTMLGGAMMQFRNWIPEMMEERFDGLKFDEELQTWTYGRARSFFGDIFSKRLGLLCKSLITGLGETSTIELAKQKYQDLKAEAYEKGRPFDITEGEFVDLYIGNIKALMTELILFTGLSVSVVSVVGGDDDKKQGWRKYLGRALKKYYNEFAFYYNPMELTKILDQPLPVIGLATDMFKFIKEFSEESTGRLVGNEEWIKDAKPLKYFNKMVPIGKEAMMWMAVFDDDFRKEWDIRIQ